MIFPAFRNALFLMDPEKAHGLTITGLKAMPALGSPISDPALRTMVAGLDFPNPVGLAAGFDKNAEVPAEILSLGFGFTEVGTLTPKPQVGNDKPRLFRLSDDRAVINRMGFNNDGLVAAGERLSRLPIKRAGPIGVNVGANKDSANRIADYAIGVAAMAPHANYLTINISSPNTPGLRELQGMAALNTLLSGVMEARGKGAPPIFLKIAPDLEPQDVDDIVRAALDNKVDALIVANTTISRPDLSSRDKGEMGGLSGRPLAPLAMQRLKDFRKASGGGIPLIAAGGIDSADEAWARIRAGASLVQIYSAMVYEGPTLGARIARGLSRLAKRDGFAKVSDAVGIDS